MFSRFFGYGTAGNEASDGIASTPLVAQAGTTVTHGVPETLRPPRHASARPMVVSETVSPMYAAAAVGLPQQLASQQATLTTVNSASNLDGRVEIYVPSVDRKLGSNPDVRPQAGLDLNHDLTTDGLPHSGRTAMTSSVSVEAPARQLNTYGTVIVPNISNMPQHPPSALTGADSYFNGHADTLVTNDGLQQETPRDEMSDISQSVGMPVTPPTSVIPSSAVVHSLVAPVAHHDISTPQASMGSFPAPHSVVSSSTDTLLTSSHLMSSDIPKMDVTLTPPREYREQLEARDLGEHAPADGQAPQQQELSTGSPQSLQSKTEVLSPEPSSIKADAKKPALPPLRIKPSYPGKETSEPPVSATSQDASASLATLTSDVQRLIMSSLLHHGMTETAKTLREEAALHHEVSEEHVRKTQRLRQQRTTRTLEDGEARQVIHTVLPPPGMPATKASKYCEAKEGLTQQKHAADEITTVARDQGQRMSTMLEKIESLRQQFPEPTPEERQVSQRLEERMGRLKQLQDVSAKLERTGAQHRDSLTSYRNEKATLIEDIQTRKENTAAMLAEAERLEEQLPKLRKDREGSETAQAQRIRRLLVNWDAPHGPKRIAAETFARVDSNHDGRLEMKNDELQRFTRFIFQSHNVALPAWPEAVWLEMYRLCDLDRSHALDVVESLKFARCCFEAALRALVG